MLDIQKLLKKDGWELQVHYIGNGLKNLHAEYRVPMDSKKLKIILRKIEDTKEHEYFIEAYRNGYLKIRIAVPKENIFDVDTFLYELLLKNSIQGKIDNYLKSIGIDASILSILSNTKLFNEITETGCCAFIAPLAKIFVSWKEEPIKIRIVPVKCGIPFGDFSVTRNIHLFDDDIENSVYFKCEALISEKKSQLNEIKITRINKIIEELCDKEQLYKDTDNY